MKKASLEQLLLILIELKEASRGATESCVTEQFDEAIQIVKTLLEEKGSDQGLKVQLLVTLGRLFEQLPSFIALLDRFL